MIENIKICGFGQQPCNEWEEGVLNSHNIMILGMNIKDPNPRDSARWDFPLVNSFKINFDRASKGNPVKQVVELLLEILMMTLWEAWLFHLGIKQITLLKLLLLFMVLSMPKV